MVLPERNGVRNGHYNGSNGLFGRSGTHGFRSTNKTSGFILTTRVLTHVLTGFCCFYAGMLFGWTSKHTVANKTPKDDCPKCPDFADVKPAVNCDELERILEKHGHPTRPKNQASRQKLDAKAFYHNFQKNSSQAIFPPTLSNMFVDYGTINRDDFMNHLDLGVPPDDTRKGSEEVLILYSSDSALPPPDKTQLTTPNYLNMDPATALENCQTLKVILHQPHNKGASTKCMAIVPQWESFNIFKYMRVDLKDINHRNKGGANDGYSLKFVSRSHSDQNMAQHVPNYGYETKPSFDELVQYLQAFPKAQAEIMELLTSAGYYDSTTYEQSAPLIVQVCNKGQSELLVNFVCTAKARNLDISRLFVFATDQYTLDLCRNMGIQLCYSNEDIFGQMPEKAAHHYADGTFAKMMMAKVYVVHLILTIGFPVLFQDVDLVWYKDPIPYFLKNHQDFDILFQDDGARTPRYAPYSPNSGFYFVRYNDKTLFTFNRLLKMGDTIYRFKSHQAALTAAMNEMATWIGLKVKVFRWGEQNQFLGGVEFHRKKDFMRKFFKNDTEIEPYIFHMSWTENKDNKKLYFEQMGEWRVKTACNGAGVEACCLAQPNIVCHYRDKPSIIPCRDSPPIDNGKPSFW